MTACRDFSIFSRRNELLREVNVQAWYRPAPSVRVRRNPINERTRGVHKFRLKTLWVALHDLGVTFLALVAALALRGEPYEPALTPEARLLIAGGFALFAVWIYWSFSLYAARWRFASLFDLFGIFKAVTLVSTIILVADYLISPRLFEGGKFFGGRTIIIYWCVQVILLGGPRVAYRAYRHWRRSRHPDSALGTLIIGQVSAADGLVRLWEAGLAGPLHVYGIITPSPEEVGQTLRGIPVWGSTDQVEFLVEEAVERGIVIQRAVFAPELLRRADLVEPLMGRLRRLGVSVVRLDIAHSSDLAQPARLHKVIDEDLLLRPLVEVEQGPLQAFVRSKRVVVTGGAGSIGAELALRSAELGAAQVLVIDHSEAALHAVLERAELSGEDTRHIVEGRLCDVRDRERLIDLFVEFSPDVVFHAAALKHVPHLEREIGEAVRTNVFGTVNAADAAIKAGAEAFVLISTDKATRPTSILGATKRIAELYVQALNSTPRFITDKERRPRLVAVRFGNVVGTAGSVIPRFRAQIEAGGPLTVTDPSMVRYFMTKREATDLLWTAARIEPPQSEAGQSAVLVLNMGQPVRIDDLARRMIVLAGLEPDRDIKIVYSGIRPGERLTEYLFQETEAQFDIGVRGIVAAHLSSPSLAKMRMGLENLATHVTARNDDALRQEIRELVPEFEPMATVIKLDEYRSFGRS